MKRFAQTGIEAFRQWHKDRCGAMGASLSFYQTLFIAPFFVSVMILLSRIVNSAARFVVGELGDFIGELIGPRAQSVFDFIFRESGRLGGDAVSLSLLTIAGLLLGSTEYFVRMGDAFRGIWGGAREERTAGEAARGRLASLYSTVLTSLMLLASLLIGILLFYLGRMALVSALVPAVLIWVIGIAVVSAMYFATTNLCYRWIPDDGLTFKETVFSMLLVTALHVAGWALASALVVNQGLRSASAIVNIFVIQLLYLFYFNLVVLYGAEFILVSGRQARQRTPGPVPPEKREAEHVPAAHAKDRAGVIK